MKLDLTASAEEIAFRQEVCAFLESNAPKQGAPDDFVSAFHANRSSADEFLARSRAWQELLSANNWAGIDWPTEFGGRGGTRREAAIFAEEQRRYGVSTKPFGVGLGMAGPTIIAHGSALQQSRLLPPILVGKEIWCQLFSEPSAGSDLASVSTRAELDGAEWVINGQKVWTSGARDSDWGILLARTDPSSPRHRGLTYFLCDMRLAGIDIRPIRQMNDDQRFAEVFLSDVRLPLESVLGDVNGGWRTAMTTLGNERLLIGDGIATLRIHDLLAVARLSMGSLPSTTRAQIAVAYSQSEILRYLGLRVRSAMKRDETPGAAANVMKLLSAQHVKLMGEVALAMQGAAGTLVGSDAPYGGGWQHTFLSAPSARIAGGTDEIQRNILGERILGLPREPRPEQSPRVASPVDKMPKSRGRPTPKRGS